MRLATGTTPIEIPSSESIRPWARKSVNDHCSRYRSWCWKARQTLSPAATSDACHRLPSILPPAGTPLTSSTVPARWSPDEPHLSAQLGLRSD